MSEIRDGLLLLLCAFAVILAVLLAVVRAEGHPGRLDASGCHNVYTRFVHKSSGKVDELGSRHCHRPLGQMRLDGREQLEDGPPRYVPRQEDRSREAG